LQLRRLRLFSRKPIELAQFLAEVFDYTIQPAGQNGSIEVSGEDWSFLIDTARAEHLFSIDGERDVEYEFLLNSVDDLEDLGHKIEFHFYRSKGLSPGKDLVWECISDESCFWLRDPEGRRWRFSSMVNEQ